MSRTASTPVAAAVILMVALGTAAAQVAPAPMPTPATASTAAATGVRPGWVAQAVSFTNNALGEVPLASVVLGADRDDAYAVLAKQTGGKAGGLLLKGVINAPEDGQYGFVLEVRDGDLTGTCDYALTIDGKPVVAHKARLVTQTPVTDKAVELAAGQHPIGIQVGCGRPNVAQVRVVFRVKLPSAEVAGVPAADFIVHPTRASGD